MEIRVLGHLEASVDEEPVALGGAKQRAVLAMLALDANRTVTADRLSEGLWGEEPPPSAAKMVQNYVWRLRRTLNGGAEIVTHGRAYELRIDAEHVDVCRLERLVSEAGREAGVGDRGDAARAALALFRGEPLADVADEPFAGAEIRRLEDLRLTAAELAIEADLAAGRHQHVVAEIDALLAENPLRERLHGQRMLALYRCGRQAEALDAYRRARETLVEEIGVEPGPELQRLHEAILRQEPSLDVDPAVTDLQRELDAAAAPPLVGRDGELERLLGLWRRAASGTGALATLAGGYGMGKTRLAAELAGAAHRDGAAVLYAPGTGPPDVALAAIARARDSRRPALLVIDDADRAPTAVRAALRDLDLDGAPVLVLATGLQAAALARLEPRESIVLESLDADGVAAIAGLYAPAGRPVPVEALLATSGGVPRHVHEAAGEWARREATRRVDAAADRAAVGRSEARALEDELAGSVAELQSARERHRTRCATTTSAPRLPLQGPRDVRRRRRGVLLRARAPGRRSRGARRRRAAAGRRRAVRQRQVVGRAGRAAAGAGRRRPPRQRQLDAGPDPPGRATAARRSAGPCDGSPTSATECSRSTSSRSCSPPARTRRSARSSSPRSCATRGRATASSCSRCARTSTAAAPPTPSCRGCSARTTCSSARCRATSCGARSSSPRSGPA